MKTAESCILLVSFMLLAVFLSACGSETTEDQNMSEIPEEQALPDQSSRPRTVHHRVALLAEQAVEEGWGAYSYVFAAFPIGAEDSIRVARMERLITILRENYFLISRRDSALVRARYNVFALPVDSADALNYNLCNEIYKTISEGSSQTIPRLRKRGPFIMTMYHPYEYKETNDYLLVDLSNIHEDAFHEAVLLLDRELLTSGGFRGPNTLTSLKAVVSSVIYKFSDHVQLGTIALKSLNWDVFIGGSTAAPSGS